MSAQTGETEVSKVQILPNAIYVHNKNMNMKKTMKNSRSLNSVCVSCVLELGMHGGYQCVAQLSLSQVMAFFWLFVVMFSHGTTLYVFNIRKLA